MTRPAAVGLGVVGIAVGLGLAATLLHASETAYPAPAATSRLLYVQSGATADRLMLSFDALASDVYWIRAIQSFGRDRKHPELPDRFALLQPLLDVTTSLDPHFNIAYRFGAIYLSLQPPNGPGRTDQAIALLEKGLAANPTRWQYAHDIAFIHYWYTGDYQAAAQWFDRAASMPNAPSWIRPIAALTLLRGGDRAGARTVLNELRTSEEAYVRQAAERGLLQLQALDEIDQLQALVEQYHEALNVYPSAWADVARASHLRGVPPDPSGFAFLYDAASHRVQIDPRSPLNPLPKIETAPTIGRAP